MTSSVQLIAQDQLHCEVRFAAPSDDGSFDGVAVRFNTVDSYRTTFDPAAFAWDGNSLPLLWAHDPSAILGSVRAVTPDSEGLRIKARLNLQVAKAREAHALLKEGDLSGLSIGFRRLKDETRPNGVRHITQARLMEVSLVAIPSVPGSRVTAVRSVPDLAALTRAIRATTTVLRKATP